LAIDIEIEGSRKELEPLANEQLILRALASLISHTFPNNAYYQVMASILRERSKKDQMIVIHELLSQLNDKQMWEIKEEWF
jgi:hypothetical protein